MSAVRSARGLALSVLREWRRGRAFADEILHRHLALAELSAPDRGFATELTYSTLRNLRLLDQWIALLRQDELDPELRDIVRLGLLQLLLLDVPPHAAVFETVSLARRNRRAVANAMLRSAQRRRDELRAAATRAPLAIRTSHPDFLIRKWVAQFAGAETEMLCAWNNRPAPIYLRVNELRIAPAEFAARYTGALATVHPLFFRFDELPLAALRDGEAYVQDPSTALAVELLDPQPGDCVLDACAAPGGKTSYIAQLMRNAGSLVACDRDSGRLDRLRQNLHRLAVANACLLALDWLDSPDIEHQFDRILIDAPCSNTGVMRRRVDVRWRLRPNDFARMQHQQLAIVRAVLPRLKPGGVLVYSTCSIEPEENDAVVDQLLSQNSDLVLEAMRSLLPFRDAIDGAFAARLLRRS